MWIHQYENWPNLSWDHQVLAVKLAEVRYKQGLLLGKLKGMGYPFQQQASFRMLTYDAIHTSAIEGEILDREEVRSSLARRLGVDIGGLKPSSRQVEGLVAMMLDATQNFKKPLTAKRICNWHAALFPTGRSGMQPITVGAWRKIGAGPMQVVSGPIGRERVHFEAPGSSRLDREMEQFLSWFESPKEIDPVLKAGVAHFWFVTIHPFDDGNGRIARAVADLALARSDQSPLRFYSMSTQIEREREAYYQQLEFQQKSHTDITDWLNWFLGCLGRALDQAEEILSTVFYQTRLWDQINQQVINERQRTVLGRMLDNFQGFMNTSKYAKMAKCSTDTALRDIQQLVEKGILLKNPGGGRSTSYRLVGEEELG